MRLRSRVRPSYRAASGLFQHRFTADELGFGRMMSMSQFGEDVILAQLFRGQQFGFYVDVGALHPASMSNTYALHRRGWRGINIEPQPHHLALFEQFRPDDVNLGFAVGTNPGIVKFHVDESYSSVIGPNGPAGRNLDGDDAVPIEVPMVSLAELLREHGPDTGIIDLLDVDCEGTDIDVLRSNDWNRFRPRVVLVERHKKHGGDDDPRTLLEAHGYELFCNLGPTSIFLPEGQADSC